MFQRHHTIPDVDRGVIPDNPANLNPSKIPKDNYATNPFRFGGDNIRFYKRVPTALRKFYSADTTEPQMMDNQQAPSRLFRGGKMSYKEFNKRSTCVVAEGRNRKHC